jgi:hypothetical protein
MEPDHPAVSLAAPCALVGLNRGTWYAGVWYRVP